MQNQMILTPFYLDEPLPELEILAAPDWIINKPLLPDGEKQQRLSALHKPLADFAQQIVLNGKRPVSIAGDCCTPLGMLDGYNKTGERPGNELPGCRRSVNRRNADGYEAPAPDGKNSSGFRVDLESQVG